MNIVEKETVSFSDDVFHKFYKNTSRASCILIEMLEDDILDLEGIITLENIDKIQIDSLWLYIYYLWKHNNDSINNDTINTINTINNLFNKMTSESNKASASLFINTIVEYLDERGIKNNIFNDTKSTLLDFLFEIMVDKKWRSINIPIFKSIYGNVIKKLNDDNYNDNNDNNDNDNDKSINIRVVANIDGDGNIQLDD